MNAIIIIINTSCDTWHDGTAQLLAQLNMFNMEKRYRNKIIIIIKFDRADITFNLTLLCWLKPLTNEGWEENGVHREKKTTQQQA